VIHGLDDGPMIILRSRGASDVGAVRAINQDRWVATPTMLAIADGMGGHVAGDVAARVAVGTFQKVMPAGKAVDSLQTLVGAVHEANTEVWEQAQRDPDLRGMGTTLTAVALLGSGEQASLGVVNVGDSRAYLLRSGDLYRLTRDHSVVEELVRRGEIEIDEAQEHPQRHMLTRALGIGALVEVDAYEMDVSVGDKLLLCSDGLTNEVSEADICAILASDRSLDELAATLIGDAIAAGGNDNVTVVLANVESDATTLGSSEGTSHGTSAASTPDQGSVGSTDTSHGTSAAVAPDQGSVGSTGTSHGTSAAVAPDQGSVGSTGSRWPGPSGFGRVITAEEEAGVLATRQAASGQGSRRDRGEPRRPGRSEPAIGPRTLASGPHPGDGRPATPARAAAGRAAPGPAARGKATAMPAPATAARATAGPAAPGPSTPGRATLGKVTATAATPGKAFVSPALLSDDSGTDLQQGFYKPRWLTARVVIFFVVLLGVLGAAGLAIRWYAMDAYYVGLDGTELVIYQGHPGGVLWYQPKVVERSGFTTADVLAVHDSALRAGIGAPSIGAARQIISGMVSEYRSLHAASSFY